MNYYDRLTTILLAEAKVNPKVLARVKKIQQARRREEGPDRPPINAGDELDRPGSGERLGGSALGARTRTTQVVGYRGSRRSATS